MKTFNRQATLKFQQDPASFLLSHFVKTVGQGTLKSTRVGKQGANDANKFLQGAKGEYAYNDNQVDIVDSDTVELTAINNNSPPIVYVGLYNDNSKNEHYLEAEVRAGQDNEHFVEVLFLAAAANRLVGAPLPTNTNHKIALTDALTGCTIFTSTLNNQQWWYHVNAVSLKAADNMNDHGRIYMRNLWRHWIANTAHTPGHMLHKPHYEAENDRMKQYWFQNKTDRGRDVVDAALESNINAFAIKDNNAWVFKWQQALTVESERTGFKSVFMGKHSSKYKIELADIPVIPNNLPNP